MLQKIQINTSEKQFNINIEELNKVYNTLCVFDSNASSNKYYDKLIAIGAVRELRITDTKNALSLLQNFIDEKKAWLFGSISYDLKNEIEHLSSSNADNIKFPLLHFFEPKFVIESIHNLWYLNYDSNTTNSLEAEALMQLIYSTAQSNYTQTSTLKLTEKVQKEEYIKTIDELKKHIQLGNIYEINYCQEYYAINAIIQPVAVYEKLNAISKAPLAAFCKFNHHYLISSSPERYIKKSGNYLLSQPIKGTAKRSSNNAEDELIKTALKNNLKEQTENVMIVDLVRNDLSKIAAKGSVQVDELFGTYSFKQVHQLISTVSCTLPKNTNFTDIIKATFPMGSMTGAPKVSAMKLIEAFEKTKRGLYSGTIGYINPEGDFDFSVVIRSILYNSNTNNVSLMVGSAITAQADAEQEYNECLLKAKALIEVLETTD